MVHKQCINDNKLEKKKKKNQAGMYYPSIEFYRAGDTEICWKRRKTPSLPNVPNLVKCFWFCHPHYAL